MTLIYIIGISIILFAVIVAPIIWWLMRRQEKKEKKLALKTWNNLHNISEPIKLSYWQKMKIYFKRKPKAPKKEIIAQPLPEYSKIKDELQEFKEFKEWKANNDRKNNDIPRDAGRIEESTNSQ